MRIAQPLISLGNVPFSVAIPSCLSCAGSGVNLKVSRSTHILYQASAVPKGPPLHSIRVPASIFTPKRRRASVRVPHSSPSGLKNCTPGGDELWISRSAPAISIPLLREAICSLDSRMATLMSQRHELESHLEQAVRLQSPVSRLPAELLSSVFVMGVLGIGDENPVMVSTLMLVCRYWSEVALNTPILWSKVSVGPHDSLDKARRKLDRSKSCPLDITVDFGPRMEYTSSITEHVIRAMDLIRPALWRTKTFHLSIPNRPQAHVALLRCQEDAPLLETLSIHIFHAMQDDAYSSPPLPLFNGRTPRLRSCSLTSFNFGWDRRLVSGLRVLKLGGYFNSLTPSASTLLGILRQCPDLEELALRNMSSVDSDSDTCLLRPHELDPAPPSRPIELCRLKKLSFYYSGVGLTRQLMSQLALPSLDSLEMCYLENITPVLHLLCTQALTRLPLRRLRIETCLFNEMKFLHLLRRLHCLEVLELVDMEDASSNLLKCLSSSQPWICPQLEALTLDGCTTFHWDSLRTLVESRLPVNPGAYTSSFAVSPLPSRSISTAGLPRHKLPAEHQNPSSPASQAPRRLCAIDVTRCSQISKEMVQWLRMYVADVKCEPAKGVWGEAILP
ncbi:putative F-box-like [Lyophyllum shimeji]|uniref:F-box-like n=1 Tax=Lyophyllum shimeji TaxID=47721 RepID=A0A9P3PMH6_LYOSH|nr:putative F-box-like [Lyophyllum shimeji]